MYGLKGIDMKKETELNNVQAITHLKFELPEGGGVVVVTAAAADGGLRAELFKGA